MAVAVAPNPSINAIPDGKEGESVSLGVTLNESGARYDRLTYQWSGADGLINATTATPRWNRPEVSADHEFSIRCEVTAHGDGHRADSGTTAVRSDTEPATVLQVPDAVAPTGEVVRGPVGRVHERDVLQMDVSLDTGSGTYDRLTYEWRAFRFQAQTPAGITPFSNDSIRNPMFTCPSVGSDQQWVLRCVVTAHGDNGNARRGTFHSRTLTDVHVDVRDYPDAQAPSFTVQGLSNGISNAEQNIGVTPSGGHYDRISYRWSCWQRGTDPVDDDIGPRVFDDVTSQTPRLTNPFVRSNTVFGIRCTATVEGRDNAAEASTTAVDHTETAYTVSPLPSAVAPSVTMNVPRGNMREKVGFRPVFSGGTYDHVAVTWTVRRTVETVVTSHNDSVNDRNDVNAVWTRPVVSPDDESVPFFIQGVFTFSGRNQTTLENTSASHTLNVRPRVDYVAEGAVRPGAYWVDAQGHPHPINVRLA